MKNKITAPTTTDQIKRTWHLIDANEKILGRISTEIAKLLMGKSKPYFSKNLDCGDYVVVVNAKEVKVTGNKEEQKNYYRHSGYPGGFRKETLAELRKDHPERVIQHAVKGMLPKNKLQAEMLKRLRVYSDNNHPYAEKFTTK